VVLASVTVNQIHVLQTRTTSVSLKRHDVNGGR
jgi:hypothetical protein